MSHKNILMNLLILTEISLSGCSAQQPVLNKSEVIEKKSVDGKVVYRVNRVSYGKASWYGERFEGKKTASGEPFRVNKKTAAHKLFPFGTKLKVTNLTNKKSVIVRVNDRGPYSSDRIIDLSKSAADKIGLVEQGIAEVKVEIVNLNSKKRRVASLPTSTQRCESDDCKATLAKSNRSSSIKPFAEVAKTANPNRISVYGESLLTETNSAYRPTKVINSYPKVTTYNQKNSVQIGAFRNRIGATTCANRYSLLSRRYKAVIKNGTLNREPIYRVQIEGFSSESEARRFIAKYKNSLSGAFLVRR